MRAELTKEKVQFNKLVSIIETQSSTPVYIGVSFEDQFNKRCGDHEKEGFHGTIYYFKTTNMCTMEDKLLGILKETSRPHYNKHEVSNKNEFRGYVYVIVGHCYNSARPIYYYEDDDIEELMGKMQVCVTQFL
jgi:hypothetical protein